jgi:hypoxanthine phosphoribosyltransferase
VDKRYISPGDLLRDAYELGWRVFDSGYRPDYLIGIWRGGTPIAIAIHELLHILGVNPDHLAIRTVSYTAIGRRAGAAGAGRWPGIFRGPFTGRGPAVAGG